MHYFSKNSKNHCVKLAYERTSLDLTSSVACCNTPIHVPCLKKQNFCIVTNLESRPKKIYYQLVRCFFFEKKISWCQLFVYKIPAANIPPLPPHYLLLQIKIVWNYIIFYQHTSTKFASKPNHTYWIFKWKKSWMIGASSLFFEILFVFYYYKTKILKEFLCKYYIYIFW